MSDDQPRRFKSRDELSIEEEVQVQQAERRGEQTPHFEREEYRDARREAVREAGLEPEEEPTTGEKSLEEMTPDEHFDRIRRGS